MTRSLLVENGEQKADHLHIIMLGNSGPAMARLFPTIMTDMQAMFISLLFSQIFGEKLVLDQGTDSHTTLISLSDDEITSI